ncbi:ABC transporter permease [Seohaeicola zhoushanensis]
MTLVETTAVEPAPAQKPQGYWAGVGARLVRDPLTMICAGVVLALILAAVFAPWLGLADPYKGSMIARLKPIGTTGHLLGTDEQGRDMFARLIYGGRLTLFIGLMPVVLAFFIGSALGIVAGFVGGLTNTIIMRTVDVFFAFPRCCWPSPFPARLGRGS